ncbi:YfhO family protein [Candidatus Enterococcus ikei]|uniref:YfhO family protein n=1 Tax=Candidatus Enterococcus ikei TaxID=2815326 RepID=A0ABS3GY94_9ENTE|nr:YfhO family protein [Enterococcus sp. DIV0869a]MBO0439868.1 YfhO family protein [Enterococcus sp. DIV0869a]
MKKILNYIQKNGFFLLSSFIVPIMIMVVVYYSVGVYPGGPKSILVSDAFSQYSNFHASFNNVLHGKQNIFYSWYGSLGINYWALISYYLGGIFTPLVYFFDNQSIPEFFYFLTLLKIGSMGVSFWLYAQQTFTLKAWQQLILSIMYAQMSFLVAHAEIVMWIDALIYLPLVVLGIDRIIEKKKPIVLFVTYLLLFLSNFYMSFMIGIFTVLYFIARLYINKKEYVNNSLMYLITSVLSGLASMIIILPMLLDIRNNGEELSKIKTIKTASTGVLDIIVKNMIGIYDSTKYGTIPFIYIGLFPLILCLLYFMSKKVSIRNKIAYGSLFLILILSFYFEPLNLFWHGFHSPNMFLFRFSFLFSFLLLMVAGYSWEKLAESDFNRMVNLIIGMITCVILVSIFGEKLHYTYISVVSIIGTIIFLIVYLLMNYFFFKKRKQSHFMAVLFVLIVVLEASLNSKGIINGMSSEWRYPKSDSYEKAYQPIRTLVDKADERNTNFYRMENLSQVTINDSFNYGYAGVGMFSSIRNRHSSEYLSELGFFSVGTNLSIRYENNTLLMDSLLGIKYIIDKTDPMKYGFEKIATEGEYSLYENKETLPLGIYTNEDIFLPNAVQTQIDLYNQLSGMKDSFFSIDEIALVDSKNVEISESGNDVEYRALDTEDPIVLIWEVDVPAKTQSYISLYPVQFNKSVDAMLRLDVGENSHVTEYRKSGQFFNIGYYEKATKVKVKALFYLYPRDNRKDFDSISFIKPDAAHLDITKYQATLDKIKEKAIDFKIKGRKAIAKIDTKEEQVIFTTIPYDKGWKAYVDDKEVEIPTFKDAFLAIPVPKGKHTLELVFLPQGFLIGAVLFVSGISLFIGYVVYLNRKSHYFKS